MSNQVSHEVGRHESSSRQGHRHLGAITRLSETNCTFATSLITKDEGSDAAAGVIFTLAPQHSVDLLALEFLASGDASQAEKIPGVQVYFREGADYIDVISQSSEWQQLADTDARIINELRPKAIIPTNEFQRLTMEAGRVYAIYAVFPSPSVKVKVVESSSLGLVTSSDDFLQVQTGVSMDVSQAFPNGYSSAANYHGAVHYQLSKQCQEMTKSTTDVIFKFASSEEPSDGMIEGLTALVEGTVSKYMTESPLLKHFNSFHGLAIQTSRTGFEGRSDVCPPEFEMCSLLSTTVTLSHLSALQSGDLQLGILGGLDEIAKSVVQQSPVVLMQANDPIVPLEFMVTVVDVPSGVRMNPIQRRYFEKVTMELLKESAKQQIYAVSVRDEVDGNRRRILSSLRGKSERQTTGTTEILLQITSAGDPKNIRQDILDVLGSNDALRNELVGQQLRPGEINQQDFGSYFGAIDKVQIQIKPADFVVEPKVSSAVSFGGTTSSTGTTGTEFFSVWTVVCFVLIIMSVLTILYRIYKDCFQASFQESSRNEKNGVLTDASGSTPLEEENDSDIESVGIADLSDGDQESDNYSVSLREEESSKQKFSIEDYDSSSDESSVDSSDEFGDDSTVGNKSDLTEDSAMLSQAPSIDFLSPVLKKREKNGTRGEQDEKATVQLPTTEERDGHSLAEEDNCEALMDSEESTVKDNPSQLSEEESSSEDKSESDSSGESSHQSSEESEIELEQIRVQESREPLNDKRKVAQSLPFGNKVVRASCTGPSSSNSPGQNQGGESNGSSTIQSIEAPKNESPKDESSLALNKETLREPTKYNQTMREKQCSAHIRPCSKKAERSNVDNRSNVPKKTFPVQKGASTCKAGPPKKVPPKKHPPRNPLFNSQHSRGSQRSGPRNLSGMKGRGVTRSKSLPEYPQVPKKHPPKKHLPFNSQHSRGNQSIISGSMHSESRKLNVLEASKSNRPAPKNQSGINGRRIVPSKSMPVTIAQAKKPTNATNNNVKNQNKCLHASNHPGRSANVIVTGRSNLRGQTPERSVRRAHSAENLYGKAGKIKFVPKMIPLKK